MSDFVGQIAETNASGNLKTTASIAGDVNIDSSSVDTLGLIGKPVGGDFTTAANAPNNILCAGLPADYPQLRDDDIVSIMRINAGGEVTDTWTRDDITINVAGNVISITGVAIVAGESFVVYTNIPRMSSGAGNVAARTQRVTIATDDANLADINANVGDVLTTLEQKYSTAGIVGKDSGGDFTTAWDAVQDIECTNLPSYHLTLTDMDIVAIVQIANTGAITAIYHRDHNTITVAGNVITVVGATFVATDSFVVYTNIKNDQAYDSTLDSTKTIEQSPAKDWYTDEVTLVSDSDIGAVDDTWVDQGAEIDMRGKTRIVFYVSYTENDSDTATLQILSKDESGGAVEYDLEDTSSYQKSLTDGQTLAYRFTTDNVIPFLQVQTKALDVDTGGGTEGTVTITYTTSWV